MSDCIGDYEKYLEEHEEIFKNCLVALTFKAWEAGTRECEIDLGIHSGDMDVRVKCHMFFNARIQSGGASDE